MTCRWIRFLKQFCFTTSLRCWEEAGVTANKETVNCSLGFVLAFPRLLERRDSGVAVTNLPVKHMPVSSVSRVGFL